MRIKEKYLQYTIYICACVCTLYSKRLYMCARVSKYSIACTSFYCHAHTHTHTQCPYHARGFMNVCVCVCVCLYVHVMCLGMYIHTV